MCIPAPSNSSSASPLAVALIFALIVSVIVTITAAVVVIRRKANRAMEAEAIVSDAFWVSVGRLLLISLSLFIKSVGMLL